MPIEHKYLRIPDKYLRIPDCILSRLNGRALIRIVLPRPLEGHVDGTAGSWQDRLVCSRKVQRGLECRTLLAKLKLGPKHRRKRAPE